MSVTVQSRDNAAAAERETADAVTAAYGLVTSGLEAARTSQDAAWRAGLDTFTSTQRFWLDQWQTWSELGLTAFFPITPRQLDERFEQAERAASRRQGQFRAEVERVGAELREAAREASRAQAQSTREAIREQRAELTALQETIRELTAGLDRLAKAESNQVEAIMSVLATQEERDRDRHREQLQRAIGSLELPNPRELAALREQVASLGETLEATRRELGELARESREARAAAGRSGGNGGQAERSGENGGQAERGAGAKSGGSGKSKSS